MLEGVNQLLAALQKLWQCGLVIMAASLAGSGDVEQLTRMCFAGDTHLVLDGGWGETAGLGCVMWQAIFGVGQDS